MALEINEIGIHFRVPDAARPAAQPAARGRGAGAGGGGVANAGCGDPDREQIVDDCVRRVLRLLAARAER